MPQESITPDGIIEDSTASFDNVTINHNLNYLNDEICENPKHTVNDNIIDSESSDAMVEKIISFFGEYKSSDTSGNVCVSGKFGNDFMLGDLVYCFNKREISNITCALYELCSAKEEDSVDNTSSRKMAILQELTEQIENFHRTDYLLIWECMKKLPRTIDQKFAVIAEKLLVSPFANYSLYNILSGLQSDDRLSAQRNFTILNSDLLLSVWHPYKNNITGIALYEDQNGINSYWIEHIYDNETSDDIDLENLKIAGYIPINFLNELTENSTIDKEHLYVILIMIMNAEKYNGVLRIAEDFENYIGIAIPRFCKNNTEPMLRAFFKIPNKFEYDYFDLGTILRLLFKSLVATEHLWENFEQPLFRARSFLKYFNDKQDKLKDLGQGFFDAATILKTIEKNLRYKANKLTEDLEDFFIVVTLMENALQYLNDNQDKLKDLGQGFFDAATLLKASSKQPNDIQNEWKDFGQDYFDSLQQYDWYTCSLSVLSYFGRYPPDFQDKQAKILTPCESYGPSWPMESYFNQTIFQVIVGDMNEQIQNFARLQFDEILVNAIKLMYYSINMDTNMRMKFDMQAEMLKLKDKVKSIVENSGSKQTSRLSKIDLESLKMWSSRQGQWILQEWESCFNNYVIYYVKHPKQERTYFETVKETYCMEKVDEDFGIKWRQTPVFTNVYPEKFCLDQNLELPSKYCYERGVFDFAADILVDYSKCYEEHPISNKTESLYQILINSENRWLKCNGYTISPTALVQEAQNYVDVSLVLKILYKNRTVSVWPFLDALEKGLQLLEEQGKNKTHMTYISAILRYFIFRKSFEISNEVLVRDNFIYLALKDEIVGLVLYKHHGRDSFRNYIIKRLVRENATKDLSQAEDVEVVIYLNSDDSHISTTQLDVFIIYNTDLTEYDYYIRTSRLVVLSLYKNNEIVQFTVFLKPVDDESSREGQWTTVSLSNLTLKMLSIVEPRYDVCDSTSKLSIFSVDLLKSISNSENDKNITSNKIIGDFLSQLVVSVNTETKEIHNKHSHILNTITICLAIPSAIALALIFVSLLVLKDWYKKRFYSIQLAIAVTCETVFFILDDKYIYHIAYVLFYYSMLAQFAWMMIIGYIQYIKFVEVFNFSELNIWKSLVLGWVIPFIITLASVLAKRECLGCKLCSKNGDTFTYFVILPVGIIILCNVIIYIVVNINISKIKTLSFGPEARRAWLRAALILPFVLGISWIFILAFVTRWSWMNLMGSYLFHIIAPSQGLVLFVFMVVLDQDTRKRWVNCFSSLQKSLCASQTTDVTNA